MTATDYDLIVIGGGPGGSCAAAFARQAGMKVCVIEKEAFPRFRIGESLLPMGNRVLQATGVWPKIQAAGFIKKFGAMFCLADGTAEKTVDFSQGYVPGLAQTYQVERARFDGILLDHAREAGAEVRMQTAVRSVASHPGHVSAQLAAPGGGESTITARWLVDAGGRDNLYGSALKRELDPPAFTKRVAIYTHFQHVPRASGRAAGHTVVVRIEDGWFWLIPLDSDRTSVGLVTNVQKLRDSGLEPGELFRRTVASSPKLRELMGSAEPTMEFRVTADYSYFRRELATERIVLAGDAGGFFDPIFSSGVYMAMWSAQEAVAMITRADTAGRPLTPSERQRYTQKVKKHASVFQRMIRVFYDNDSFAVFLTQVPPMDLGRGINSIVAGHAKMIWPLWWRFQVFLLVCRLQKRFHLVKPIDYTAVQAPS